MKTALVPWYGSKRTIADRIVKALERLYPGWAKHTIEVTKALVQQGQRDKNGATKAMEVLLVNDRKAEGLFE